MAYDASMAALMSLKRPKYMVTAGAPTADLQVGEPHIETPQYQVSVGEPQIEQQRPSPAALAALQSNDDAIRQHIAQKLTRSNVLGVVPDNSGLIPMTKLASLGFDTGPDAQGQIPAGLDPRTLNSLETKWLSRKR